MKLVKFISIIITSILFSQPATSGRLHSSNPQIQQALLHLSNADVLKNYIIKFHARGGAYIIMNSATEEQVDKEFIGNVWPEFPIWSHNTLRLLYYAVGLHTGAVKEDEEIIFNTDDLTLLERVNKEDAGAFFKPYIHKDFAYPLHLLSAYVKVFRNADNYLSAPQLAKLQSAVSENVKSGKAKLANVEDANVSGLSSTTFKSADGKVVYTVFIGEFEADNNNYAIITLLDSPEALKSTYNSNSSGWNAVPLAADLIKNIRSSQSGEKQ